jgi:hypothetical protein
VTFWLVPSRLIADNYAYYLLASLQCYDGYLPPQVLLHLPAGMVQGKFMFFSGIFSFEKIVVHKGLTDS